MFKKSLLLSMCVVCFVNSASSMNKGSVARYIPTPYGAAASSMNRGSLMGKHTPSPLRLEIPPKTQNAPSETRQESKVDQQEESRRLDVAFALII